MRPFISSESPARSTLLYLPAHRRTYFGLVPRAVLNAVAILLTAIIVAYGIQSYVSVNSAIDSALPGLTKDVRTDIKAAILLAPVTHVWDKGVALSFAMIRDPYGTINRRSGPELSNEVAKRIYAAQRDQDLAPRSEVGGVASLSDVRTIRQDSAWQVGNAINAALHADKTLKDSLLQDAPPLAAKATTPETRLIRTVFEQAYGEGALNQATAQP